jgi:hypothetical protein
MNTLPHKYQATEMGIPVRSLGTPAAGGDGGLM